jgi:hypothetical protein
MLRKKHSTEGVASVKTIGRNKPGIFKVAIVWLKNSEL